MKPQGSAQLRHSHFLLWQMLLTISPIPPPPQTCFLIPLLQDGQEGWVSTEVKGEMKSWKACSESAACGWNVRPKLGRHPAAPTSTREPQPTSCHVMLAPHPPWARPPCKDSWVFSSSARLLVPYFEGPLWTRFSAFCCGNVQPGGDERRGNGGLGLVNLGLVTAERNDS